MAVVVVATVPSALMSVIIAADDVAATLRIQAVAAVVNVAVGVGLLGVLGVPSVFLGTIVGTLLVVRRSLLVVSSATESSVAVLLGGLGRPLGAVAGLTLALAAVRALPLDGVPLLLAVSGVAVAYAGALVVAVIPRGDLRYVWTTPT
jgi:hypothetical protein